MELLICVYTTTALIVLYEKRDVAELWGKYVQTRRPGDNKRLFRALEELVEPRCGKKLAEKGIIGKDG